MAKPDNAGAPDPIDAEAEAAEAERLAAGDPPAAPEELPPPATVGEHAKRTADERSIEGTRFTWKANGVVIDPTTAYDANDFAGIAHPELIEVTGTQFDTEAPEE